MNMFPSTNTHTCLTKLVLTLNNVSLTSMHSLQIKNVTTGTGMGPEYAWHFVRSVVGNGKLRVDGEIIESCGNCGE